MPDDGDASCHELDALPGDKLRSAGNLQTGFFRYFTPQGINRSFIAYGTTARYIPDRPVGERDGTTQEQQFARIIRYERFGAGYLSHYACIPLIWS